MRRLAIVGSHSGTRDLAPWDDPEIEIWVFNEAPQHGWCKRWDACFQLHKPEVYRSLQNVNNAEHWNWLQKDHGDKRIWMQDEDPAVPNSKRYPMEAIRRTLPGADTGWFTSTAAMALALALYFGFDEVHVYGVDLSSGTEYAYQQMCWLYWVGVGKGLMGSALILHSGKQHFQARLYGYEGETQIEKAYFQDRIITWMNEKRNREKRLNLLRQRIGTALLDGKFDDYARLIVEAQEAAQAAGEAAGGLQEAEMYAGRDDPISRQQFERRGAQAQEDGDAVRSLMDKESGKVEYVFNVWKTTGNHQALQQLRMFGNRLLELAGMTGGNLGVWRENARYMIEYDQRVTAAGGQRTLQSLGLAPVEEVLK